MVIYSVWERNQMGIVTVCADEWCHSLSLISSLHKELFYWIEGTYVSLIN